MQETLCGAVLLVLANKQDAPGAMDEQRWRTG